MWCRIWDENSYEPVNSRNPPGEENIYEEIATIEMSSPDRDENLIREKIYTYGETSELEGRREKTLYDDNWDARSEGRRWRGRSKSRCRDIDEERTDWQGRTSTRKEKRGSPGKNTSKMTGEIGKG